MATDKLSPGGQNPRPGRPGASSHISGQPNDADDPTNDMQDPAKVPSQLGDNAGGNLSNRDEGGGGERHGSASFLGHGEEPPISDDHPPRGQRGLPNVEDSPRNTPGGKSSQ